VSAGVKPQDGGRAPWLLYSTDTELLQLLTLVSNHCEQADTVLSSQRNRPEPMATHLAGERQSVPRHRAYEGGKCLPPSEHRPGLHCMDKNPSLLDLPAVSSPRMWVTWIS
jgi:hypothetical protein